MEISFPWGALADPPFRSGPSLVGPGHTFTFELITLYCDYLSVSPRPVYPPNVCVS